MYLSLMEWVNQCLRKRVNVADEMAELIAEGIGELMPEGMVELTPEGIG